MIKWKVKKRNWEDKPIPLERFQLNLRRHTDLMYMKETEENAKSAGGVDGRWSTEKYIGAATFERYLLFLEDYYYGTI